MGIAATFSVLASLPREEQIALAETALREPYPELQIAAFDVLVDPGGLNEPERVLQRFLELLPEVREKMASHKPVFANLAREFVRSTVDRSRRVGYEVLASLYQMDALPALVQGVRDPAALVRERVGDLLENLALKYYYLMSAYRTYGDAENKRFLEDHRAVMLQALGDLMRSYADHRRRIFVDIVMETGGEAYPLVTDVVLSRPGSPIYDAFLHALTVAQTDAAVELIFRLYQESDADLREAARRVMARRIDPAFAALVVGMLVRMSPDRMAAPRG